jgi:replicative DNA helicase
MTGTETTTTATPAVVPGVAVLPEEKAPEVKKYDFDTAFQAKIAALVLRDARFVARTDGLIKPDYFELLSDASLINLTLRYYQRYKRIPADRTIYGTLIREAVINKTMKPDLAKMCSERIKQLWELDISDRDYVVDQVAEFACHQEVCDAMTESIKDLDKRNFPKIKERLNKALNVGANIDVEAYDYGKEIDSRTGTRLERAAGKLPPQGISTGYLAIDEQLYHKGWGIRELSVLMGGAKAGKTTALIDFGVNAAAQGRNVLYVTLEVGKEIIADRMDANISQRAIMELGSFCHDVREKVQEFVKKAGLFKIHEFPSGYMTVNDLRRLIERYKSNGVKFDLAIVDYADLMQPEHRTDSAVENSKNVYVQLRGLAMAEDIAILTATQTNREGYKATVAKAEHVSEDFNKIRIADLVISINRTDEERSINQARLFFAASRNQAGGFSLRIEQALDRMKFVSKVLGVE